MKRKHSKNKVILIVFVALTIFVVVFESINNIIVNNYKNIIGVWEHSEIYTTNVFGSNVIHTTNMYYKFKSDNTCIYILEKIASRSIDLTRNISKNVCIYKIKDDKIQIIYDKNEDKDSWNKFKLNDDRLIIGDFVYKKIDILPDDIK